MKGAERKIHGVLMDHSRLLQNERPAIQCLRVFREHKAENVKVVTEQFDEAQDQERAFHFTGLFKSKQRLRLLFVRIVIIMPSQDFSLDFKS